MEEKLEAGYYKILIGSGIVYINITDTYCAFVKYCKDDVLILFSTVFPLAKSIDLYRIINATLSFSLNRKWFIKKRKDLFDISKGISKNHYLKTTILAEEYQNIVITSNSYCA